MTIELFPKQQEAKDKFLSWFNSTDADKSPIFHIFGYAGTGKSFVTNETIKEIDGKILFEAFTGKAALVMTKHGNPASTIHSLIYTPVLPDKAYYNELKASLEKAQKAGDKDEVRELYDLNRKSPVI